MRRGGGGAIREREGTSGIGGQRAAVSLCEGDGREWGGSKEMGKAWELAEQKRQDKTRQDKGGRALKNMRGTGVRDMRGRKGNEVGGAHGRVKS